MSPIAYRREIDGLRAIAVTAVVLYHAGVGGAGFVGVDVFFVVSGYLITALLLREHEQTGRIDLLAFYARRVRRIFPAATVLVLCVLGLAYLLLPPSAQSAAAYSAEASAAFGANIYFQTTTGGYFDAASDQMPLLHLWSLAVEEQFYFLWPALLIVLMRWRLPAMVVLAVGSLVLAEWLDPHAAFYQMPARFWELVIGGLVATLPLRASPRWLAPVAMAGVVAACLVPPQHFPGLGALPAVLASAALLWAIRGGASNALLASRLFVGVGLISYSLYLWHWPLLALYRATIHDGTLQGRLILCAVAVVLAVASYRYIETPFRRGGSSRRVIAFGVGALSVTALTAFALASVVRLDAADLVAGDAPQNALACNYGTSDIAFPKPGCTSIPGQPVKVALWGDSMALAWQPIAVEIGKRQGMSATAYSRDDCRPAVGYLDPEAQAADRRCLDWNGQVAAALADADTVFLAGRWQHAMAHADGLPEAMDRSLTALGNVRRVVVLGPGPELPGKVPDCMRSGDWTRCSLSRAHYLRDTEAARTMLTALVARHQNAEYIEVGDWLCPKTCEGRRDGVPLYWDNFHITTTAARVYAGEWDVDK